MNWLNGISEEKEIESSSMKFWDGLKSKPLKSIMNKKEQRITNMNIRFKLLTEKNQLLSIIAQLNSLLNTKQDEIDRL